MPNESTKWLYEQLTKRGYNVGKDQAEFDNLMSTNADSRKWAFETARKSGLNVGEDIDEFSSLVAPQQQVQPTATAASVSTPAPVAPASEQSAPEPEHTPTPQQPAWQPTEQEKIRMSYQMATMLNDFNRRSRERIEQIQRVTEPFTPEGRQKRRTKEFQARLAGTPTKVMGVTPPTSAPVSDGEQGKNVEGVAGQQSVQSEQSPVPYGVAYVDGRPVTQWLLSDGRLTTSLTEADQAEYGARTARLRHQFENRMKDNGLDPTNPEDVEKQARFEREAPLRQTLDGIWKQAETEDKAADEEYRKDRTAYEKTARSNIHAMGPDGMPLPTTEEAGRELGRAVRRKETFNLERMAHSLYNGLPEDYRQETIQAYKQYFSAHQSELKGRSVQKAAEDALKAEAYNAVYQRAVAERMPKSKTEFLLRKIADQPLLSTSQAMDVAASAMTGSWGTNLADQEAMSQYGQKHRALDITGTVVNMAIDPTTYISGGVGGVAGKKAIQLAGMQMVKGATKDVAERYAARTLTGRIIGGVAGGSANFATFETLKNVQQQTASGGHFNPETGEHEGFSFGEVIKAGGHGLLIGGVTGSLSPIIGNVADKAVKATANTVGKVGIRAGETAVSTIAEGTVFSIPEWISGDGNAYDVWTDNMAMMLGFKASHGIKSAPRIIAGLRPVKPVNGRLLTQAERNHNRMNFEERLRRNLDASPNDLSFTADEREELRKAGYGELADLFKRDRKQDAQDVQQAETTPAEENIERIEVETVDHDAEFDGYSAMEQLMQDGRVSQAARAKAYYVLTGRMLPMGTVTGYTTTRDEDGRITINAMTANGEVVTSRTFMNEQDAKQETDNIMRQAELNSVDVGERYREAVADDMVLDAAVNEVSPDADPETVKRIYQAVKSGNKDYAETYSELVEMLDDAIGRNKDIADGQRPEAIRNEMKDETGIDVDAVLRKTPDKRTEAEQAAVKSYLGRLFPDVERQQNAEPTPEQEEAQSNYNNGRLLYGRFEEGDPAVQADVDAISLRMQEAYEAIEDAFGPESEYYMYHVNEHPWELVNDPELTIDQRDAVLYYINAKAALDGVMDASNEAADRKRAEVEESVGKRTHKDSGVIIPAIMKVDDRQVYIVKGDVAMFPDDSAVDVHNSSESVVVMDTMTGEYEFTSPDQIFKVSEAVNPQDELDAALSVIEQERMSVFGDNAVVPDGMKEEAYTEESDRHINEYAQHAFNGEIDGDNTILPQENIGALYEYNKRMYEQDQERRAEEANRPVTALSRIPINDEGEPMFEAAPDKDTAWDGLVEAVGNEADAADIAIAQVQQATADLEALRKKQPTQKSPKLKGSPMAMAQAKREAAEQYQSELAQYNQQIAEAKARLDAWNGIAGVYSFRNAEQHHQQEEERRQRDAIVHEEAVARLEEEKRIKAEKQAEQERIGSHAVNPKIKAKWDVAPKIDGHADAITLPDGSTIRGHYVLTEAGAASASHDVNNAYQPTEGFPIDENGQSVNDRDYMRDKDAQRIVEQMADSYDNRAMQSPVIVSRDGVVLSGNNRTMSGDLAARQGTDKAYVEYLREFGQKYGFTPEQVQGMNNPRLVFVPDEDMPYDATTFSRFNAQEMKSQSKPEAAVKLGKIVPDNVFTGIANDISRYDRLSDYYADEKAVAQTLGALMQAGVINDKQMPEMRTGTALSAAGKELIENTLIGKVFQTSPDAVRQIISMPALRQSIVMGLNEIANNRTLSRNGYDISDELAKAVDLVTRAKTAYPDVYVDGMPVSPFGRQQGLFDDEFGDSRVTDATTLLLADILNSGKSSDLRKVLNIYNNEAMQASGGQMDMFSGSIPTKEEILKNVNDIYRKATPKEQQALVDAAVLSRREAANRLRTETEASNPTTDNVEYGPESMQPTTRADSDQPFDTSVQEVSIQGLERYSRDEIKEIVRSEVTNVLSESDIDADILDIEIHGSRNRGDARPDSDLDVVVEYNGDVKEDSMFNLLAEYPITIEGIKVDVNPIRKEESGSLNEYMKRSRAYDEEMLNIALSEPTEAQKAAGNYKMEHRRVDGYNISIENAKGSVRRGTGADGKKWETEMHNDYGYIRGTEGVDGDHIDVFLSDTPEKDDVFVVDQVNEDGSFDEHKVMYGFPTEQAARDAYLSNYEPGWTGLGAITHVSKEEFKKWIQSSKRKTKPFAEYKSVKIYKENNPQLTIEPDGFGDFGPVFTQFKGNAQGAVKVLSELQNGEAIGALHHKDIGDIDLVWGSAGTAKSDGFGLAKLVKFHPEVIENLQEILDDMHIVKRSENRINLESNTHKAAVRLTWNKAKKKWLLTAFEKKETSESIGKTTDTDENPLDLRGDTTLSQNSDVSDGKVNTLSSDKQADGTESSESYTITPTTYTNKKGKTSDVHLVKFNRELTAEERSALDTFAREPLTAGKKTSRGWYDRKQGGYMMRSEEAARQLAEMIGNEEAVADAQPLSKEDVREAVGYGYHSQPKPVQKPSRNNKFTVTDEMKAQEDELRKLLGIEDDEGDRGIYFRDEELTEAERKKRDRRIFSLGVDYACNFVDNGIVEFPDFAKAIIARLGTKVKPFIKAWYDGLRRMPDYENMEFTAFDEVSRFDIENFDRPNYDAIRDAEMRVAERKAKQASERAEKEMIEIRNLNRKKRMQELAEMAEQGESPYTITSEVEAQLGEQSKEEGTHNGYKVGDDVMWDRYGNGKWEKVKIEDFDADGSPIFEAFKGVMSEKGDWSRVKPADGIFGEAQRVARVAQEKKHSSRKKNVTLKPKQSVGDLFGSLFDNSQNSSNHEETEMGTRPGEAGGQRQQLKQDTQVGGDEPRRETERPAGEAGSGSTGMDSDADRAGGRGLHDVATQPALERLPEKERKNVHNNHVERGTEVAPKSESARIKANIAAIETMKKLEASGEAPTAADMKKLHAFSGWGGLGKAFSDWDTSRQLRQLLGDKLYDEGAEMSRNSAYFTPAYIVDAMWDIARAMGFKGGRVLEGSAGIGNVLGLMPQDLSERSYIRAVEKDPTTGKMLSLLYPDAVVDIDGFEKVKIETGTYDLVITNVPFVPGLKVADTSGDADISKEFKTSIHDFCIAKNVRKLRDGGVGVFITTAGSMDGTGRLYKWLANRENADIVGMFRMHNETFGGTNATSDIIVVRKRVNGVKSPHAIDCSLTAGVRTAEYNTGETKKVKNVGEVPIIKTLSMSYNRYYVEHPEYMAGEMHFGFEKGDTSFRPESKGLYPVKEKDQSQLLSQWVEDMKRNLADTSEETVPTVMNHRDEYVPTYDKVGNEVKTGTIVVDSQGRICVNYDGTARPLMSKLDNKSPKSADERIVHFNKNKVKGRTRAQVVQDYNAIKKALNDLLEYQKASDSDEGLQPKLKALNRAFNSFVATYGHLHGNNGLAWLKNDVDYPSVIALETYCEEGLEHKKVFGKADIFSRRVVVRPEQPKATNVRDGVTLSIRQTGSLDTRYISEQLGMNESDVRREVIEAGLGYENPLTHSMEAAHEYLSGNVREKMQQAEANNEDGRYTPNITALRKVVPHSIPSHFIEFSIGSSWLRPELFEQYVKERTGASVKLTYAGGMWAMDKPRWTGEQDKSFGIRSEICDKVITGTELIEAAMTNRTIRVSKQQKDGPTISDPKATSACAAKVDEIRDDFKSWLRSRMEADPELAKEIEERYNDIFNNSAPMTIPDEYIPEYFDGAARVIGGKPIKMRKHQAKAIVRGTMQSLMLAHEVGTGKTFTLITTAMEMRRLGTAKKPMIVVQNATLGQFVASAKALYPDARILSLEDRDRNAEGRKDFYAKIRYNDWDMVVIPQSVLERIPDHPDRERRFIEESIQEKMDVIEAMSKDREAGRVVAALKKDVENLRDQLNKLSDTETAEGEVMERVMVTPGSKPKKDGKKAAIAKENAKTRAEEMLNRATDDTLNFDDLGVDAILVDEAHEYKHLGFATAMQRDVKGVDSSYSKKCQGLYLKVKAVQEKSGGRNVIFATGTPISNTAAEVWTFMRYLFPREVMEGHNIWHFDDFVRNFGSIQQMLEFTTQGIYKENNRFAGYSNLPELARIWAGITDTVLTAEAGEVKSQIPELEGGQPTDLYLPQTNGLRAVLKFVRAQLKAYDEMSGQEKKENSHIPLVMYGIAKAAAIDARLVMANAPDDPHSKTNESVRQTLRSLEDSKAYNGTVAIFADNYQRKNKETGAVEFNLFDDIRTKLIAQGVPAEQVVIMRDGMTDKAKEKIFAKVNAGEIRVILGTTQRLGVGVNIQERLHTLMHIDAPNRPMDYWQRMGRLLRQGNMHKEMGIPVRVIRFGVEDSLDVTAYQRLKTKGAIADAIMHSKDLLANNLENRILEEEGDEFGNITAELSGSQYAMLQNQTEKELRKLQAKQDQHRQHQMYIHRAEPRLREAIERNSRNIERSDEILALLENNPTTITINGKTYQSREDMQKVFEAHNKAMAAKKQSVQQNEPIISTLTFEIGNVHFTLETNVSQIAGYGGQGSLVFDTDVRHKVISHEIDFERSYGDIPLKRIINELVDNVTNGKEERSNREAWVNAKERAETDLAALLKDKGKPFEHGERIKELEQKLEEYTVAMQEELREKEAKYAEMDAETEDVDGIVFTHEDDEDSADTPKTEDGAKYREDDDIDYSTLSDSATIAMEARVADLSKKLHTPIRVIHSQEELNEISSWRKRNAKGWWSATDNEIVVALPNNINIADVDNTVVHEVVGHKGLRALIGEERFDEFLGEIYDHASNPIRKVIDKMTDRMVSEEADRLRTRKAQAHERAGEDVNANYYPDMAEARVEAEKKREGFRKEATEEYMSDLGGRIGSEGFEKMSRDELTLWGKIKAKVQSFLDKFLRGLKIAKSIRLNDKDLSYILFKSWKNMREKQGKGGVFADAEDAVMRRRTGYDADEVTRFRDPGLGLEETITKMKAEALQANTDNLQAKRDAMRAIGGNLNHLRQAMARQREYDITTAKSVKDLARILMENGLLNDLAKIEVKSLLKAATDAIGRQDISKQVNRVFDVMLRNHLRNLENLYGKLLAIRGSKVDARGIQVQGELDPDGQMMIKAYKSAVSLPAESYDSDGNLQPGCIAFMIGDAMDRMSDDNPQIADNAAVEYAGLQLARMYADNITASKNAEALLRAEIHKAEEQVQADTLDRDTFRQFKEATEESIQEERCKRIESYEELIDQMGGALGESIARAKAWRSSEKERVNRIHHLANSDMQGRELQGQKPDSRLQNLSNNPLVRWAMEPLATFDQLLKMFGRQNANGEGYLHDNFMRHWIDATDREQLIKEKYQKKLDDKAAEIFGKGKKYVDLYNYANTKPSATIKYYDGADMREYELSQDALLYLYAVEKMPMGKATNRRMGITDDVMAGITEILDDRLKEYADWVQEELLPELGLKADEVHQRMFGVHMDAIENYFPFVRDTDALKRDVENGRESQPNNRISVQTGAIKKRQPSVAVWNLKEMSFFDVNAKHIAEIGHWLSFAELNRDLGTLLSYNRFKQQVKGMSSIYGAGSRLWKRFCEVCAIATDAYEPKRATFDRLMVQGAKGVTMGKIAFRPFTALKQTLSLPAFFGDVNLKYLAYDLATGGIPAIKWAWKNMPNFRKRILSRTSGDYRLRETEYDGKIMKASTYGMFPNMGVDAWTIAIGAHGVYQTNKAKYLRWGMDESEAEHRAIQDAELNFNKSQQSSEGAYLAPIQVDHTFYATSAMLFRNASTSYTREEHNSARNLKRIVSGEANVDFMAKQWLRTMGLPEEEWSEDDWRKARRFAKEELHRAAVRNSVNLAIYGWILPWLWRIGGIAPLLLLSSDDDEKQKQRTDALKQSAFAPIEGLAYGDVIEDGLNMLVGLSDKEITQLGRSNPMISDVVQTLKHLDKDWVRGVNDVLDIVGGMCTGINPQTLTDWVVAIMDASDDRDTQKETALLVARLLNCPQSQLDKIYFDELDASGEEASQMTPHEIAERYAEYKMHREAPLTGWMRSEEAADSIRMTKEKRALNEAKARLSKRTETEETRMLLTEYDRVTREMTRIKKLRETDMDAYRNERKKLRESVDIRQYGRVKRYKHDMKQLTKRYLRAATPSERDSVVGLMFGARDRLLEDLSYTQQ